MSLECPRAPGAPIGWLFNNFEPSKCKRPPPAVTRAVEVVAASWAWAGVGCWDGGEVEALQAVPRPSSQKLKVVGGGVDRAG